MKRYSKVGACSDETEVIDMSITYIAKYDLLVVYFNQRSAIDYSNIEQIKNGLKEETGIEKVIVIEGDFKVIE